MNDKYWKRFKSGTDIRGVASDGVEGEEIDLTNEAVEKMTKGFAVWLKENAAKDKLTVSVGHDSRISAQRIKNAVIKALCDCGIAVLDCSLSSTPAMFMTTVRLGCDGAVQITASHHPFNKNGLKFFTKNGGLESGDIDLILQNAAEGKSVDTGVRGSVKSVDFMSEYARELCDIIKKGVNAEDYDKPLSGYHIVVDAGNGAGGFYAERVLKTLGADISGSQFSEPDGMFPNHIPNPENAVAMGFIQRAVIENKADLGIIFDTDVDRAACVASDGNEINRNRLVALAAAVALEGNEGGTIVTDSVTSSGLADFIENKLGGKHLRFKRGYKNVINKSISLNAEGVNSPLAIETSGHAAFRENYFLDDGAYLATKIIIKAAQMRKNGESLDALIKDLKEPAESRELRMKITDGDFASYGGEVIKNLTKYAENQEGWCVAEDNFEGVRVYFDKDGGNGWFLLRLSVHDPIMPLNIESDSRGGCKIIASRLYEFLKGLDKLETDCVRELII